MNRVARGVTVGAGLVAAAVLVQGSLAHASPDDGHRDGGTVLEFDVRFSPFDYTDLAEPGPSAADLITFDDVLLVDGAPVGHEVGSCVLVAADGRANCTAVLTVDGEGTVAYALENSPAPRKALAVTGGSGGFAGVTGDGVLVENGDGTGTLTLDLELDD